MSEWDRMRNNGNNQFDVMRSRATSEDQLRRIDNAQGLFNQRVNGAQQGWNALGDAIGGFFDSPPAPKPKASGGGGGLGLLVAGAALAGGAYLLSKVFGGSDDKKSSTTSSNTVNDNKKDANAYLSSGNDYYNKRQYELAIKDYTKAIILNPDFATAYYNRGNAYQALGGNTANAKSDFARAKQLGYYG